jgi:aldehyde:ferredoxin oxidoreductase
MTECFGKVARVNLTLKSVIIENSKEYYQWLGGRGFASYIIASEVPKDVEPLSAENKIVLATGCLTGTSIPGSSRVELVTKNALNNGISYSSGGGNLGPELKKSNFDAIIIEGKSDRPVYIYLHDGMVEIKEAIHLSGRTTWETEDMIKEELLEEDLQIASIGPAGENLVKISCVIINKSHALAWGGSGAIMGYKKLKAIVAKGNKSIEIYDENNYEKFSEIYNWTLLSSSASDALRRGGTHGMAGVGGWSGKVPTSVRNLQEEFWECEKSKLINEEAYKRYEQKRAGCFNCPLLCLHYYEMERDGECLMGEGMHANSVRGFGSNWDVDDPFYVFKSHILCNQLGLDVDGVSSVIACAIESYENKLINDNDTFGLKLNWGNGKDFVKLIEEIAYKKNFGKILSEGVYEASNIMGKGTSQFAMHVKKVGINEQGLHSHRAWSLGVAVSTRGGGHLSGSPQTENRQIPNNVGEWLFNVSNAGVPASYRGKGKLVAWYEIYKAIIDSLGICYFDAGWYEISLASMIYFKELFISLTGIEITKEQMWNIGKRIVNFEKAFNAVHAGFNRTDDTLPERIMNTPLSLGPYKGESFDSQEFKNILDEYYLAHGWDKKTGLQTRKSLEDINGDDILKYLISNGIEIV